MPPSPPNSALATFRSYSRAADRLRFDSRIPDQTTALAACRLTIADQAILSLITRVDSLFDGNQFPVKFEQGNAN
jgi:hypothetical protein